MSPPRSLAASSVYDKDYYDRYHSDAGVAYSRDSEVWLGFFKTIAGRIQDTLSPRTVVDCGCALGFLVEALRDRGIEAFGMDVSEYAISNVRADMQPFCFLGAIEDRLPAPLAKKYDLCTCIEVLEHIPEGDAAAAIENMTRCSDTILFSSSPEDDGDDNETHINVKSVEYWISLFERFGFQVDVSYDASFVSQHALLFRKRIHLETSFPRPLRIFALTAHGHDACGEIRLLNPLGYLKRSGSVEIRAFHTDRRHPPSMANLDWADICVLQRVSSHMWRPYLTYAAKKGMPVIYELDDNLLEMPERHPEFKSKRRARKKNAKYQWFLDRADCITTSTRPLAQYLRRFSDEVALLRNYYDSATCPYLPDLGSQGTFPPTDRSQAQASRRSFTIGYAGTSTHSDDCQPLQAMLRRLSELYPKEISFYFQGYLPPGLEDLPRLSFDTRLLPYGCFLGSIHRGEIDLALAPLQSNTFNACKSNIKFLEYAMAGTPGAYSDVEPYRESIRHGVTGFLVEENTPDHWFETLKWVMDNRDTLQDVKANARRVVMEMFLLRDHFREWWDCYVSVLLRVRGELS